MWETYPNIEYDEKTRRLNRIMKVVGIPIGVGLIGACTGAIILVAESVSDARTVFNDAGGTVVCNQRFESQSSGSEYVRSSGQIEVGEQKKIGAPSACAVFDSRGGYVGCLRVPDDDSDEVIRASTASRNISAVVCVTVGGR